MQRVGHDVLGRAAGDDGRRDGRRAEERVGPVEREGVDAEQVAGGDRERVEAEVRARGVRGPAARGRGQDEQALLREARAQVGRLADERGRDGRERRAERLEAVVRPAGLLARRQGDDQRDRRRGRKPPRLRSMSACSIAAPDALASTAPRA